MRLGGGAGGGGVFLQNTRHKCVTNWRFSVSQNYKNLTACYCAMQTLIITCSKWQDNLQKWYMNPLIMHIGAKWNIKPWGCSSPSKICRRAHKNAAFQHLLKSVPLLSVSHTHRLRHQCTDILWGHRYSMLRNQDLFMELQLPLNPTLFICFITIH